MCSSERSREVYPELPEREVDLDDPLWNIPTDYRPLEHRYDNNVCPKCGSRCSEDELATYGGHRSHFITPSGSIPRFTPTEFKTSFVDRPPIRILLGCPKPPSLEPLSITMEPPDE